MSTQPSRTSITIEIADKNIERSGLQALYSRIKQAKDNTVLDLTHFTYEEGKYIVELYLRISASYIGRELAGARSPKFFDEFYPKIQELYDLFNQSFHELIEEWTGLKALKEQDDKFRK
jgi:hypothetical protein